MKEVAQQSWDSEVGSLLPGSELGNMQQHHSKTQSRWVGSIIRKPTPQEKGSHSITLGHTVTSVMSSHCQLYTVAQGYTQTPSIPECHTRVYGMTHYDPQSCHNTISVTESLSQP